MKRKRHTPEQIIRKLRTAEQLGLPYPLPGGISKSSAGNDQKLPKPLKIIGF